jgi:hypothetical protein
MTASPATKSDRTHSAVVPASVKIVLISSLLIGLYTAFWLRSKVPALPIGHDYTENLLAAEKISQFHPPVIANLEFTRYPLGYAVLIAIVHFWMRLPLTAVILLNVLAIAGVALGMGLFAPLFRSRLPLVIAAVIVVINPTLWTEAQVLRPETIACLFSTLALGLAFRAHTTASIVLVALAAAAAIAAKTLALPVAVAAAALLAIRDETRKRSWIVLGAAAVVLLGGFALAARYPAHTTGYAKVMTLRDPWDASQGNVGLSDLIPTMISRARPALAALGNCVAGYGRAYLGLAVGVLTLSALLIKASKPLAGAAALLVTLQAAMLLIWPYHEPRFWLSVVPLIALGFASLVDSAVLSQRSTALAATLILAVLTICGLRDVAAQSKGNTASWSAAARELPLVSQWLDLHAHPTDVVASFDYRELYAATHRRVRALSYTSDVHALTGQFGDAAWLVSTGLFVPLRSTYARKLARALALKPVYATAHFTIYPSPQPAAVR